MRTLLLIMVVAAAGALAAPASTAPQASAALYVASSSYGPMLFAGKGRALYAFTRDPRGRSACSGACARAWPPFVVKGSVRAGKGARGALVGVTRRADGSRQVTYAGRPLYFYVGDRTPGQVLCQDVYEFGGRWLVVRGNGRLVR